MILADSLELFTQDLFSDQSKKGQAYRHCRVLWGVDNHKQNTHFPLMAKASNDTFSTL